MGTQAERIEELLHLMQEVDLQTLRALDRQLHHLLKQKGVDQQRTAQCATAREEFSQRYPHLTIDPDLFALVGIHPENPVVQDKILIREHISRRLAE
jgi:hypothetical protein